MSNLIERQAAIDAINQICPIDTEYDCTLLDRVDVRCVLTDLPSAQPEIIRCRDCIAYQEGIDIDGKPFTRCNGINGSVRTYGHTLPDWYCADAERRTDETD